MSYLSLTFINKLGFGGMEKRMTKKLLLIILSVAISLSAFGFSKSCGLVTNASTTTFFDYTENYQSSLRNDDALISIGYIIFSFMLIFEICFIKQKKHIIWEYAIYLLLGIVCEILCFSVTKDGCSITRTIFLAHNYWLLSYIFFLTLFNCFVIFYISRKIYLSKR